jgi:DNA repair ATPase RecN
MPETLNRIESALLTLARAFEVHVLETAERFDQTFTLLGEHSAHFLTIERRLSTIETVLEDLRDDLSAGLRAIDSDAERVVDHERRIGRLEAHTSIS